MRIRVVVRKRPLSKFEITAARDVDVIHPLDYRACGRILLYNPKTRVNLTKAIEIIPFAFDNVFDETATNVQIYERTVRRLIPTLFDGQQASVFAYGQTCSGKTFTMMGVTATGNAQNSNAHAQNGNGNSNSHHGSSNSNSHHDIEDPCNLGLYYMAALDLLQAMEMPGFDNFTLSVVQFVQQEAPSQVFGRSQGTNVFSRFNQTLGLGR